MGPLPEAVAVNVVRVMATNPGWGAKCAACRVWLTKWDFTREDAKAFGESARHDCPKAAQPLDTTGKPDESV